MDIDALLHAQDLLFYDTFPDAVPKPSDTDVQVAHINAYCPPESQPLLAYAAEYVYPNPVDSWAFYQPDLICPPRLALDLPTYDDYPFPPSATTPVSPYATFDDPSQSPPSSAVSTHSSVSVFADGSEPSTEGFCESPTAIMGPPPLDDLVPIARKRDDIVRRPVKRRSSSKPSASERRASTSARKRDTSKDKDKDKKPPLACLFCRGRKIACGPPLKGLGMAMDACNQCQRRSLRCEYPSESRRGMRKKKPDTGDSASPSASASATAASTSEADVLIKDEADDLPGDLSMLEQHEGDIMASFPDPEPMLGTLGLTPSSLSISLPVMSSLSLSSPSSLSSISPSVSSLDTALGGLGGPLPSPGRTRDPRLATRRA